MLHPNKPEASSKQMSPERPKKYLCREAGCGKAYNRPALLRQHERTHSNERPFVCSMDGCDKAFFRKYHLDTHRLSHLSNEEKPFQCSVCGKGMTSSQRLKRHEVTHTKSFRCEYADCNKAFYAWQSRRWHVDVVHKKALTCEHCNKCFPNQLLLNAHKLKQHGEVSLVQCDHPGCFLVFKDRKSLRAHMNEVHPQLKCPMCDKICAGKELMETHMLTHRADKVQHRLWSCESCNLPVQFVFKNELIKHCHELHNDKMPPNFNDLEEHIPQIHENLSMQTMVRDKMTKAEIMKGLIDELTIEGDEESHNTSLDPAPKDSNVNPEASSIMKLVMALKRKTYTCPKEKCQRKYVRLHALKKHMHRHQLEIEKANEILQRIKQEESSQVRDACSSDESPANSDLDPDQFSDISDFEHQDLLSDAIEPDSIPREKKEFRKDKGLIAMDCPQAGL